MGSGVYTRRGIAPGRIYLALAGVSRTMATYELRVTGMTCGSCESIVEQRVGGLDGVNSVDADSNAESVVVEGEDGLGTTIAKRIENTGYDVVS